MARKKTRARRAFGAVEKLKSGRYRARCRHQQRTEWVNASNTFPAQIDAECWLAEERCLMDLGVWIPPEGRGHKPEAEAATVGEFFEASLPLGKRKITAQTIYGNTYHNRVKTYLEDRVLVEVLEDNIRDWVNRPKADFPAP